MRIVGVNIPDDKRIPVALTYIFGIGRSTAEDILENTGIDSEKRTHELSTEETNTLKAYIEKNYTIEGDLRREVKQNIKRKKEIGTYEGIRHRKGLPVRGQQTQTNSRTVRGNERKTMGSGKIKASAKT